MTAHPRLFAARLQSLSLALVLPCLLALTFLWALTLPAPALALSDDPVLKRMDNVLEENARLREESWKVRKNHDREAAQRADEAVAASEERVEKTRTEALAHVAGVSPGQVESLRKDGRSWGQTAEELGVHPGFLGIGKAPLYESLPKRKQAKAVAEAEAAPKGKRGKNKTETAALKGKQGKPAKSDKPGKPGAKDQVKAAPKVKAKANGKDQAKANTTKKHKKAPE